MISVEIISPVVFSPPGSPPLTPTYPIVCYNFVFINNFYYNNIILLIIQIIIACLLIILCVSFCILTYLNINSQHSHFKKIVCNLLFIIFCCILFATIFLWKSDC